MHYIGRRFGVLLAFTVAASCGRFAKDTVDGSRSVDSVAGLPDAPGSVDGPPLVRRDVLVQHAAGATGGGRDGCRHSADLCWVAGGQQKATTPRDRRERGPAPPPPAPRPRRASGSSSGSTCPTSCALGAQL